MHLRWKNRLFVLLAAGMLVFGMTGYSVKASGNSDDTVTSDTESTDKIDITGFEVTLANIEYTYSGSAITPEVIQVKGTVNNAQTETGDSSGDSMESQEGNDNDQTNSETSQEVILNAADYKVTYEKNINAGTAKVKVEGIGNYEGTTETSFTIKKKDIADLQMEGKDKEYKGRALSADVNMYYNGVKLVRSEDYRIKDYVNNENVGTASATVKGKGNYTGERTMTFEITPKNIYELSYTPDLSKNSYKYTGQKLTPDVTFTFDILGEDNKVSGHKTLVKDVDYTINYVDNKKVGVATVMIIGKGNFSGSRITSFKIRPQDTKLKKLEKGKKSIKVKWAKKDKQVTGYVIMCSTKKDFSSNVKKVKVKKGTTKYTFKNLKSKKKYYVRVRTYKKAMGITYYSDWSSIMKIKTK